MIGIDEFDSVVSDEITDEIEGFEDIVKDLGNLDVKNREKPLEHPYNSMDSKDNGVGLTNSE